jgi:hypothetical protein
LGGFIGPVSRVIIKRLGVIDRLDALLVGLVEPSGTNPKREKSSNEGRV